MESGIQLRESWIRQRLKSGIQVPLTENSESRDWNPESKTVLDSLTWCDSERGPYSAALMTSCQWPAWQITLTMIHHALRWFMTQASGFRIRGGFCCLRSAYASRLLDPWEKKIWKWRFNKSWLVGHRLHGNQERRLINETKTKLDRHNDWKFRSFKRNLDSEIGDILARGIQNPAILFSVESGIRLKESRIPLEIWIRIQVHPTNKLESSTWNPESGIQCLESRIQDCLGFPFMGRQTQYNDVFASTR